jgi:cell division protein FtsL
LPEGLNDMPGVQKAVEALRGNLFLRGDLAKAVRKRDFHGTAWALGLLCLVLSAYVWAHMTVVHLGYQVQELKAEKKKLVNEYYYLQYRMYDVRNLSRVEQIARTKQGMKTPSMDQVVILEEPSRSMPRWMASLKK